MSVQFLDPTREEIDAFLSSQWSESAANEFDRERAIYWFACEYHGGQWTNLYSVLSTSPYRPGIVDDGPQPGEVSQDIYDDLAAEFGRATITVGEQS